MSEICTNCGSTPCYHICPNSEHYYTPEQERYDDQFYGMDDHRERYAGEIADMEAEAHWDREPFESTPCPVAAEDFLPQHNPVTGFVYDPDDLPF